MPKTVAGFRPYDARVLVKLDAKRAMIGDWLHIPQRFQEQPETGTVVAVGRPLGGVYGNGTEARIRLGSRVLFGKWNGHQVDFTDEDGVFWLLRSADIIPFNPEAYNSPNPAPSSLVTFDELYAVVCDDDDPDGVAVGEAAMVARAIVDQREER